MELSSASPHAAAAKKFSSWVPFLEGKRVEAAATPEAARVKTPPTAA